MKMVGLIVFMIAGAIGTAHAQTTNDAGTTIIFPVTAQTSTFTSEVTIFNPGPNALSASVAFYEANNSFHSEHHPVARPALIPTGAVQIELLSGQQ